MQTSPEQVRWRMGNEPCVLEEIASQGVHTVVWRRSLSPVVAAYARTLVDREVSLRIRAHGTSDLDRRSIVERLPEGPGREAFADDVAQGLGLYAQAAGTTDFQVDLDVVETDKCRRFHVDYYRLRWVCSYVGPGTEWLEDRDVAAEVLEDGPRDHEAFNLALMRNPDRLRRLGPGDVLLMKGRGFPGPGFGGPLHRSPPVEHDGLRRLVFTMTS